MNKNNNITSLGVIAIVAALALVGVVAITVVVTIPLQRAYAAAQTITTVEKIPVDSNLFVPCVGEEVHLTGKLHLLIHVTLDNAGGAHVKLQGNNQGISGTGLTTGDKYQRTGVSNSVFQFDTKVGVDQTFVFSFNLIGQGNGNKLLVHVTQHVTVNADGTVTAFVDNSRVECK